MNRRSLFKAVAGAGIIGGVTEASTVTQEASTCSAEELERCKADFAYWAGRYCPVVDQEGRFSILKLSQDQFKILEMINFLHSNNLPAKILILQDRPLGLSTLANAIGVHSTALRAGEMNEHSLGMSSDKNSLDGMADEAGTMIWFQDNWSAKIRQESPFRSQAGTSWFSPEVMTKKIRYRNVFVQELDCFDGQEGIVEDIERGLIKSPKSTALISIRYLSEAPRAFAHKLYAIGRTSHVDSGWARYNSRTGEFNANI